MATTTRRSHTRADIAADFSLRIRRVLLNAGIDIIGLAMGSGDERAYQLDDHGTHRIRTYAQMLALAAQLRPFTLDRREERIVVVARSQGRLLGREPMAER